MSRAVRWILLLSTLLAAAPLVLNCYAEKPHSAFAALQGLADALGVHPVATTEPAISAVQMQDGIRVIHLKSICYCPAGRWKRGEAWGERCRDDANSTAVVSTDGLFLTSSCALDGKHICKEWEDGQPCYVRTTVATIEQ